MLSKRWLVVRVLARMFHLSKPQGLKVFVIMCCLFFLTNIGSILTPVRYRFSN